MPSPLWEYVKRRILWTVSGLDSETILSVLGGQIPLGSEATPGECDGGNPRAKY